MPETKEHTAAKKPRISIVAAVGQHRELGKNNGLIWRIPEDLKRVKELTMGHPLIMGKKTHDSIGKALPGRTNIVITRSNICIDDCLVFDSLEKGIEAAQAIDDEEIFIFGGAQIYEAALPLTDRLYLTVIHASDKNADVFFPDYSEFTDVLETETRVRDGLAFTWLTLERGLV